MSDSTEPDVSGYHPIPTIVKDDPAKPFKTYAAIISAFLSSFLLTNATDLPSWAIGLITATVAALAVFLTGNPKVIATE